MNKLFCFFLILTLPIIGWSQPINDDCADAINLTVNNSIYVDNFYEATTIGATRSIPSPGTCASWNTRPDIWFKFTAKAESQILDIDDVSYDNGTRFNSGEDFMLFSVHLIEGQCSSFTTLESICPSYKPCEFNPNKHMLTGLTPGNEYFLFIHPKKSFYNDYNFKISINTPVAKACNDKYQSSLHLETSPDFSDVEFLSTTNKFAGTNLVPYCIISTKSDVWYRFKPDSNSYLLRLSRVNNYFDNYPDDGSTTCDAPLNIEAFQYNGNFNLQCLSQIENDSLLRVDVVDPQDSVYVRIGYNSPGSFNTYHQNTGFFNFKLAAIGLPTPENDVCTTAQSIPVSQIDNIQYTNLNSVGATPDHIDSTKNDIWFSFIATDTIHRLRVTNGYKYSGNTVNRLVDSLGLPQLLPILNFDVYNGNCSSSSFDQSINENDLIENLIVGQEYFVRTYTPSDFTYLGFDLAVVKVNLNRTCSSADLLIATNWDDCGSGNSGFCYNDENWFLYLPISNDDVTLGFQNLEYCDITKCKNLGITEDYSFFELSENSAQVYRYNIQLKVYEASSCSDLVLVYDNSSPHHTLSNLTVGNRYYFKVETNGGFKYDNLCLRLNNQPASNGADICSNAPLVNGSNITFQDELLGDGYVEKWHRFAVGNASNNRKYVKLNLLSYADTRSVDLTKMQNFTISLFQANSNCDTLLSVANDIDIFDFPWIRVNDNSQYYIKVAHKSGLQGLSRVSYKLNCQVSGINGDSSSFTHECSANTNITSSLCSPNSTDYYLGYPGYSFPSRGSGIDSDDDAFLSFSPSQPSGEIVLKDTTQLKYFDKKVWIELYTYDEINSECSSHTDYYINPIKRVFDYRMSFDNLDVNETYIIRTYTEGYGPDHQYYYAACLEYNQTATSNSNHEDAIHVGVSTFSCENPSETRVENTVLWYEFIALDSICQFSFDNINCSNTLDTLLTEIFESSVSNTLIDLNLKFIVKQFTVSGLTPGEKYKISVKTNLPNDCTSTLCISSYHQNFDLAQSNPQQPLDVYQSPVDINDICLDEYLVFDTLSVDNISSFDQCVGGLEESGIDAWYKLHPNSRESNLTINTACKSLIQLYDSNYKLLYCDGIASYDHNKISTNILPDGFCVSNNYLLRVYILPNSNSPCNLTVSSNRSIQMCLKGMPDTDSQGNYVEGVSFAQEENNYVYGKTKGSFSVTHQGAATYSIPLLVPAGVTGMRPELGIQYSSKGVNGILGEKFSMAGLSVISITGQTIDYDGKNIPVRFKDSDRYSLDGMRLFDYDGVMPYGADGKEYRTAIASYKRIVSHGSILGGNSPEYFVVNTKDGLTYTYGATNDSRIEAVGRQDALYWVVNEIKDTKGNKMLFSYNEDEANGYFYPDKIEYTVNDNSPNGPINTILFYYKEKTGFRSAYIGGSRTDENKLLDEIAILHKNNIVRTYSMTYETDPQTKMTRLKSFQECGEDEDCFAPTVFNWEEYMDAEDISISVIENPVPQDSFKYSVNFTAHAIRTGNGYKKSNIFTGKEHREYQVFLEQHFKVLLQDVTLDGDFDGDGLNDILIHNRSYEKITVYKNKGRYDFSQFKDISSIRSSYNSAGSLISPGGVPPCCFDQIYVEEGEDPVTSECCDNYNSSFVKGDLKSVDINLDGYTDLMVYDSITGSNSFYINNASLNFNSLSFTRFDQLINKNYLKKTGGHARYIGFQDLDSDGITDAVISDDNGYFLALKNDLSANNTQGFSLSTMSLDIPSELLSNNVINADLDGDGLSDYLYISPTTFETFLYRNTSQDDPSVQIRYELVQERPLVLSDKNGNTFPRLKPADFNGDGLTDFLEVVDISKGYLDIHLNQGNFKFKRINNYVLKNYPYDLQALPAISMDIVNAPMDINGDGSADLLSFVRNTGELTISINRGDGYFSVNGGDATNPYYDGTIKQRLDSDLFRGGSGLQLVNYERGSLLAFLWRDIESGENKIIDFKIDQNSKDLKQIINGLDQVTEIEYAYLNDPNVYEREYTFDYPEIDFFGQTKVVCDHRVSFDGTVITDESYHYKYAKLSLTGKGFLGFKEFHSSDNLKGTLQVMKRTTDFDYMNFATQSMERFAPDGTLITSTTYQPQLDEIQLPSGKYVCQTYPKLTTNKTYDLDGTLISTVKQRQDNDENGNAIYTVVDYGNGYIDSTYNVYNDDMTNWYMGRQVASEIHKMGPDGHSVREVSFSYGNDGLLSIETLDPNLGNDKVVIEHEYDTFGNEIKTTTTAWNGASFEDRSSFYSFDTDGLFNTSITNDLSHTSQFSYCDIQGLQDTIIDANGLIISKEYDSFGRARKVTQPDGNYTIYEYGRCDSEDCPPGTYSYMKKTFKVGPPVITYYDGFQRQCYSKSIGFGNKVVYTKTEYDEIGRTARQSDPFYEGESIKWTYYNYDALDRTTQLTTEDGRTQKIEYLGLTTITTNPKGQTRTITKSVDNRLLSVTDNNGEVLTYDYDAQKNLISINYPGGHAITSQYDLYGNKISTTDPNMGTYTYEYNRFDEMIKQIYPSGQEVEMVYDILGRPTTRIEEEGLTSCTYDNQPNGIGAVGDIASYNQTISYDYDSLSRQTSLNEIINGVSYTSQIEYDTLGRITKTHYPGSLVIENHYDSLGYLFEISNVQSNIKYYTLNEVDAYGKILTETYGNGVVSQYEYDYYKHELLSKSTNSNTDTIQSLEYTYDIISNVLSRTNNFRDYSETFSFDNLNRLTGYTIPGIDTTSLSYDIYGNIKSKSDVGIYSYAENGAGAHQLTSIELYNQDCIIPSQITDFSYTSYNKVNQISNDSISINFSFGAYRQRVIQEIQLNNTLQERKIYTVSGLEESFYPSTGETKQLYYIKGPLGTIAVEEVSSVSGSATLYWHKDGQGSLQAITNQSGQLIEDLFYDPWGKRRNALDGSPIADNTTISTTLDRGYTGHEHIDLFSLINMNGRIQDPVLGRFISPDPVIQSPGNLQNMNRYAYVFNNPLSYSDPSGFTAVLGRTHANTAPGYDASRITAEGTYTNLRIRGTNTSGEQVDISGTIIATNNIGWQTNETAGLLGLDRGDWAAIAAVAATIAVSALTSGMGAVAAGAIAGFVSAATSTAIMGGSLGDIFLSGLKGAAIGAVSAGASQYVGKVTQNLTGIAKYGAKAVGHGVTQGTISAVNKQGFWSGFMAGAVAGAGEYLTEAFKVNNHGLMKSGSALHYSAGAGLGALGSAVAGGKWHTGAITGVMVMAHNQDKTNERLEAERKKNEFLTELGKEFSKNAKFTLYAEGMVINLGEWAAGLISGPAGYAVDVALWLKSAATPATSTQDFGGKVLQTTGTSMTTSGKLGIPNLGVPGAIIDLGGSIMRGHEAGMQNVQKYNNH